MKPLLTPDQVAAILRLSRRKILSLEIPKVRVGNGRGKVLFNEDDVNEYLRSRTEYPVITGGAMSTEYRKNRKRWGYRFFLHGKSWKRYAWDTQEEAKNAEAAQRASLLENPPLRTDSIGNVAALYLIDSAEQERSKWRIDALRWNFHVFILPFFKPETPMSAITEADIEKFIKHHKRRVKNSTIHHYIVDLSALFNWAMEKKHRFVRVNPR
jgi:excisionase family DNA binding protein